MLEIDISAGLGVGDGKIGIADTTIPAAERLLVQIVRDVQLVVYKPRFSDFVRAVEAEQTRGQAALTSLEGRFLTLTVWPWEEGFDLSQRPVPSQGRGLATARATDSPAIAFQMNRRTEKWDREEILVFERCQPEAVEDGNLCLVQIKRPRARGTQTMIAVVRVSRTTHLRTLKFEPISPALPAFAATDVSVAAILRLSYRATYCPPC